MLFSREFALMVRAARKAGRFLAAHRDLHTARKYKQGHHDFATVQDLEAEKIIVQLIREAFPQDAVLAEESSVEYTPGARTWIIDPLDGTRNYANGLPHFCTSIAFHAENELQAGAVYAPCLGNELFTARRGLGSRINGKPFQMRLPSQTLAQCLVATGFSYDRGARLKKAMELYGRVHQASTDTLRFGAAALDLCSLAAGRLGAYFESGLKPWDIAAAMLIIRESGGSCTDYRGQPINLFCKTRGRYSLEAAAGKNKEIHEELLNLIRPPKKK